MLIKKILLVAILGIVLASLTLGQDTTVHQRSSSAVAIEPARAELLKTDKDFNDLAAKKGRVEAFLTYMAEDAVLFPGGGDTVSGRENIRKSLSDGPPDAVLSWKPLDATVANSLDLGYTFGTYIYRATGKDGTPVTRYGKYLTVWKKQPDGSWKFVADIGNPSPPPGPK